MDEGLQDNKRIAKNTLLLYGRMFLLLAINLYASRVILQVLGIEDYGIYNVVAGVVTMFAFLNNAMASATQRYLNFDLAKNDKENLKKTFCTSLIIHFIIAIVIILLSESIGLWFLYHKMVIPLERFNAALLVFQCALLSLAINIVSVPYNAAIIAHEKMSAFAYISLLEAIFKLGILYLLFVSPFDRLCTYAILLLIVSLIQRLVYSYYSNKNFKETKFIWCFDVARIKDMGAFASWNLLGYLALMGVTQGLNMVLNVFFGPMVNAARGIAVQVQNALAQFASNMQMAINPMITKSYAANNLDYMRSLICRGAKFSFFMILILSVPIFVMTDQILSLWLETPPAYAASFVKILIVLILVDCLSNPLNNAINATGNIRNFQFINGGLMLLVIPVSVLILYFKGDPNIVFFTQLAFTIITHGIKLGFTCKRTALTFNVFFYKVYMPCITVSISLFAIMSLWNRICGETIICLILSMIISALSGSLLCYFLGLDKSERKMVDSKITKLLNR